MERIPEQHTIDTPYLVGPVHCYTLDFDGDIILFDTGPPTEAAKKYFRANIDLKRLKAVLVTHCHIDHYGLAYWLEQETDATLYLPYKDYLKITHHDRRMQQMYSLLAGYGFTKGYLVLLHEIFNRGELFPPFPKEFEVVEEKVAEKFDFEVLKCAGHSQSDLVYAGKSWAITGDTLLREIFQSPLLDVNLETGERFSNYSSYCSSIKKLASLRTKKILPGHRQYIDGVDTILHFYIYKLLLRIERILPYAEEKNIASVIEKVFGESMTHPFHIFLKCSEILFMQDFLQDPELLKESLQEIGLFGAVVEQFARVTRRHHA